MLALKVNVRFSGLDCSRRQRCTVGRIVNKLETRMAKIAYVDVHHATG